MNTIREQVQKIQSELPAGVTLIAVTKTHGPEAINEAIRAGVTDIGENKVQEILDKYDKVLPVRWHMVGHLQTNKVKYIIDKVCLIHSVDTLRLAEEIDKRAAAAHRTMDVLIQVNPAAEESKFGVALEDAEPLIQAIGQRCPAIRIRGLMAVVPAAEDAEAVRPWFRQVRALFDQLQAAQNPNCSMEILSMGMSHDYRIAVEENTTLVRIGTAIFGARDYQAKEQ